MKKGVFFVVILFSSVCLRADINQIHIATDGGWLPYYNDVGKTPSGFVSEIIEAIWPQVQYSQVPYARAISMAESGVVDAVIVVNIDQGRLLKAPESIAPYRISLLLPHDQAALAKQGADGWLQLRIGLGRGYEPTSDQGPFGAYAQAVQGSDRMVVLSGTQIQSSAVRMMNAGRLDALLEGNAYLHYWRHQQDWEARFAIVEVGLPVPQYLGFYPSERGEQLREYFSVGMQRLRRSGELQIILDRYRIQDWQSL